MPPKRALSSSPGRARPRSPHAPASIDQDRESDEETERQRDRDAEVGAEAVSTGTAGEGDRQRHRETEGGGELDVSEGSLSRSEHMPVSPPEVPTETEGDGEADREPMHSDDTGEMEQKGLLGSDSAERGVQSGRETKKEAKKDGASLAQSYITFFKSFVGIAILVSLSLSLSLALSRSLSLSLSLSPPLSPDPPVLPSVPLSRRASLTLGVCLVCTQGLPHAFSMAGYVLAPLGFMLISYVSFYCMRVRPSTITVARPHSPVHTNRHRDVGTTSCSLPASSGWPRRRSR
eukprot:COSAG03_NODE_6730_length_1014_cov_1.260109_1_plen_289_part_01